MNSLYEKLKEIKQEKKENRLYELQKICSNDDIEEAIEIAKHQSSINFPGVPILTALSVFLSGVSFLDVRALNAIPIIWIVFIYIIIKEFEKWTEIYYDLMELKRMRREESKEPQETTNNLQNNQKIMQSSDSKFANKLNILTIVTLILTVFTILIMLYDIPNYPLRGNDKIQTKSYSYIDTTYGNYLNYEVDYTVKHSKLISPDYNFSISLPLKPDGFKIYNEAMGRKIVILPDAPNNTIKINNTNETNPLLLHFAYVSTERIDSKNIVIETPLPNIQNNSIVLDSFFVKVQNIGGHDIKTFGIQSNVTKWLDVLIQLKNGSWINQPVMIYDGGLPVKETMIDDKGILTWEINSLNSDEQKVYYFKRMHELSWQKR